MRATTLATAFEALAASFLWLAAPLHAQDDASSKEGFLERLSASETLSGAVFGEDNPWDRTYDKLQAFKKSHHLPITIGAHNWYHVDNGGPGGTGYGVNGLRGTYYWYADFDPSVDLDNGPIKSVGAHVDFRFRDTSDKFRAFFENTYWFFEAYGYADTDAGRFKAGQIWKRFGLDWDDTWWGNVQYFDGLKLDTNYGASWEQTWRPADRFSLDSFVQFFPTQAKISGSLVGANSQSVPGSHEHNIGVVRLVPTWQLTDDSSLAVGISGFTGKIRNAASIGTDEGHLAWAADATYKRGGFKFFTEFDESFGVQNPTRFVSGGPSDRITDVLVGGGYRYGPVLYRLTWSAGFDSNPRGRQSIWIPGVTIALTKNINFFAEYVHWDVKNMAAQHTIFENGFQLVLNWHL